MSNAQFREIMRLLTAVRKEVAELRKQATTVVLRSAGRMEVRRDPREEESR